MAKEKGFTFILHLKIKRPQLPWDNEFKRIQVKAKTKTVSFHISSQFRLLKYCSLILEEYRFIFQTK